MAARPDNQRLAARLPDEERDNAAQHEAGWLGSLAELERMHELGDT